MTSNEVVDTLNGNIITKDYIRENNLTMKELEKIFLKMIKKGIKNKTYKGELDG